ncbi:hypothetical protein [Streptomyces tendae]|uniref:hypothetical protein n=1 Tax=Streptomyces tendae TaxID=1932 RepID=UPI003EBC3DF0
MNPDLHPSAFDAAREKARSTLLDLLGAHINPQVADSIADAALRAGLEMVAANRIADPGAEGYGQPVHWLVYNAMHQRALRAEHVLDAAGLMDAPIPSGTFAPAQRTAPTTT